MLLEVARTDLHLAEKLNIYVPSEAGLAQGLSTVALIMPLAVPCLRKPNDQALCISNGGQYTPNLDVGTTVSLRGIRNSPFGMLLSKPSLRREVFSCDASNSIVRLSLDELVTKLLAAMVRSTVLKGLGDSLGTHARLSMLRPQLEC